MFKKLVSEKVCTNGESIKVIKSINLKEMKIVTFKGMFDESNDKLV